MNPSVWQMNIFSLPFQRIGRLQRGHLTSTIGNRVSYSISRSENPNQSWDGNCGSRLFLSG